MDHVQGGEDTYLMEAVEFVLVAVQDTLQPRDAQQLTQPTPSERASKRASEFPGETRGLPLCLQG